MVFPHRRPADPALNFETAKGCSLRGPALPFRYIDGPLLRRDFSSPRFGVIRNKVMAGGTPANPAMPVMETI